MAANGVCNIMRLPIEASHSQAGTVVCQLPHYGTSQKRPSRPMHQEVLAPLDLLLDGMRHCDGIFAWHGHPIDEVLHLFVSHLSRIALHLSLG